jgi:N-acetylglutamate synthase-like GNAT family acetyltransferase
LASFVESTGRNLHGHGCDSPADENSKTDESDCKSSILTLAAVERSNAARRTRLSLKSNWPLRLAREDDIPKLEPLIERSVRILQAHCYSQAQRNAALGTVFGVDRRLIEDGTYYVAEDDGRVVGCGGWSRRRSLCGVRGRCLEEEAFLDPKVDAARVRAFFIDPEWARRGIGRSILRQCERAIVEAGFRRAELLATLAGEPLYAAAGFTVHRRYDYAMDGGLALPVVQMEKWLGDANQSRQGEHL